MGWLDPFFSIFCLFSRKVSEILDSNCAYKSLLLEPFWIVFDEFFETFLDSLWTKYYTVVDVVFDVTFSIW